MKRRGRGIAAQHYPTGMNQGGDPTQAAIKMKPDGSVDLAVGTVDLGQGAKTVLAQLAAEQLGVPYDWVVVNNGDTDSTAFCTGTFASRGTYMAGNAVVAAAAEARQVLLDVAARELEVAVEDLEIIAGSVQVKGVPFRARSVRDIAAAATFKYGEFIAGRGVFFKPFSAADPETGECDPFASLTWGATVADVEVDTETGEVTVLRILGVYDVGRALNPALIDGQIQGGAVMGIGATLQESSYPYYPSLEHAPAAFGPYVVPRSTDVPEIATAMVEYPATYGPYGAKGVGEMTANSPAPAIANAIHDAIGVWITSLPITPEKVLRALEEKENQPCG